jgi:hypothetical protein
MTDQPAAANRENYSIVHPSNITAESKGLFGGGGGGSFQIPHNKFE